MADHIDENDKTLQNTPSAKAEEISNETIPSANVNIFIPRQETENMEVHHHPDIHHKPKKWKEYFLEFLMIFLAVTMGFIAESVREHLTEEKNVEKFLETYRNELQQHRQQILQFKKIFQKKIIASDSIVQIYYHGEENKKLNIIARNANPARSFVINPFNISAYEQIVNSGALRYISNVKLRDSIASYKNQIETNKAYNIQFGDAGLKIIYELGKLEDFHDIVSADTSASFNSFHIPIMKPFEKLTEEQRRLLVTIYVGNIAQAQSNLRMLRKMDRSNQALIEMINDELNK
jgi:ribosome recycling factor